MNTHSGWAFRRNKTCMRCLGALAPHPCAGLFLGTSTRPWGHRQWDGVVDPCYTMLKSAGQLHSTYWLKIPPACNSHHAPCPRSTSWQPHVMYLRPAACFWWSRLNLGFMLKSHVPCWTHSLEPRKRLSSVHMMCPTTASQTPSVRLHRSLAPRWDTLHQDNWGRILWNVLQKPSSLDHRLTATENQAEHLWWWVARLGNTKIHVDLWRVP